jgi:hypothetical protein
VTPALEHLAPPDQTLGVCQTPMVLLTPRSSCRDMPRPSLAIVVARPSLAIVVARPSPAVVVAGCCQGLDVSHATPTTMAHSVLSVLSVHRAGTIFPEAPA